MVHLMVELLVVAHPNLVVELLDVAEDGVDDIVDLGQSASTAPLREQRFRD